MNLYPSNERSYIDTIPSSLPQASPYVYENSYSTLSRILLFSISCLILWLCLACTKPEVAKPVAVKPDLKKMAGQSLIIALRWDEQGNAIHVLGKKEIAMLKDLQPGGVALFAANLDTVEQTRALIRQIQDACDIPPFIALDEEGGRVSRLTTGRSIHATRIPSAARLAQSGKDTVATAYGIIGEELAALGVNMDFAPVADLGYDPRSEVIGDRSFGSDPVVAQMVYAAVRVLQEKGIVAVIKHYPGHGRAAGDSHRAAQVVNADWHTLLITDLVPFMAAISAGVGGIMTAHIEYPSIETQKIPVSMSKLFLSGKLRTSFGYKGLIITDALDMAGILSVSGPESAALHSIDAGVDMLLCPEHAVEIRDALLSALRDGKIGAAQMQESFERIQKYKKDFGVLDTKVDLAQNMQKRAIIGSAAHKESLEKALANQ